MNDEAGHPIATGIICIVDEKQPLTTEWMSDEFREVLSLVDQVELRRPHNWDASVDLGFQTKSNENGLCYFIRNNNLVLDVGGHPGVISDLLPNEETRERDTHQNFRSRPSTSRRKNG